MVSPYALSTAAIPGLGLVSSMVSRAYVIESPSDVVCLLSSKRQVLDTPHKNIPFRGLDETGGAANFGQMVQRLDSVQQITNEVTVLLHAEALAAQLRRLLLGFERT